MEIEQVLAPNGPHKIHILKYALFYQIYSGGGTTGPLLNKFCNTSHPEPLTTPDNHATVHFHSDEHASDAGFQIHYTIVEGNLQLAIPTSY